MKIKCSCDGGSGAAEVLPGGKIVTVYDSFWNWTDHAQAAALVHEATHAAALTTDAVYWWQTLGIYPDTKKRGIALNGTPFPTTFQNIASSYDTWILYGFQVPTDAEVPLGAPILNIDRGERQCNDEIREHCN